MVATATDPATFGLLGLIRNDQTYAVEGVANLVAKDPTEKPESLAVKALEIARAALPLAYLEASWAVADTYPEAHQMMKAAREGHIPDPTCAGARTSLPPFREDPYAAPCTSCHQAAALQGDTCVDCAQRDTFGARSPVGTHSRTPESVSLEHVSKRCGQELKLAKDLGALARLPKDRAKRNHLATIYADGNRVGQLFAGVTDAGAAVALSRAIEEAIQASGDEALEALVQLSRPGTLPGVVTVLAADDALITVPAPFAWTFALTLTRTFNARMETDKRVARALEFGGHIPTLTAGIAFTHVKSPIEVAIQAADSAMRLAKQQKSGESAIGWVDLTHPGEGISSLFALDWLNDNAALIDAFTDLPANQRSGWERDIASAQAAGVPDPDILAFLQREVRRLAFTQLSVDKLALDDILRLLSISRWWPSTDSTQAVSSEEAS